MVLVDCWWLVRVSFSALAKSPFSRFGKSSHSVLPAHRSGTSCLVQYMLYFRKQLKVHLFGFDFRWGWGSLLTFCFFRACYKYPYLLSTSSSSSSWREAFSRSLPPLRSFARTVGPPLAAVPQSLLHPCRGRSGGSKWSTVGHRRVSTPVKAAHHPSTWCRFVGSDLLFSLSTDVGLRDIIGTRSVQLTSKLQSSNSSVVLLCTIWPYIVT